MLYEFKLIGFSWINLNGLFRNNNNNNNNNNNIPDFKYIVFENYVSTSQKTQYLRCESLSIDVKEVIHLHRIMRKTEMNCAGKCEIVVNSVIQNVFC